MSTNESILSRLFDEFVGALKMQGPFTVQCEGVQCRAYIFGAQDSGVVVCMSASYGIVVVPGGIHNGYTVGQEILRLQPNKETVDVWFVGHQPDRCHKIIPDTASVSRLKMFDAAYLALKMTARLIELLQQK